MSKHAARPTTTRPTTTRTRHRRARVGITAIAIPVAVATAGLAATGAGVYAALNAQAYNATEQSVGSGTLKLTLADNGSGFTQAISAMAPGDVVNRYVDVTAAGSLDGRSLTLAVADSVGSKLTTDATNGLHVTVTQCTSGTWTPGTGACAGATTSVLTSNAALKNMIATPTTLVSGAVTSGTVLHLQVAVTLPDQTETTTNGVLPTGTIQGLSAALTWTFADVQRTAATTTS